MSLLSRLVLLVLLAVAPGLAIQVYDQIELRNIRRAETHDDALRAAKLAAADVERIVEGARNLLVALAHAPFIRTLDAAACDAFLADLRAQYPGYSGFVVLDLAGGPVCTGQSPAPAFNIADRPYFRRAVAEGRFVVGEYTITRTEGRETLPMAMPFRDDAGRVAGVVAAAIRLDWLAEQLAARPLPPGGTVAVVDRNGIILARAPDPELWIGRPVPDAARQFLFGERESTVETAGFDGVRRIFGYIPLDAPPKDFFVSAGIGTAAADAAIRVVTTRGIALIALGLMLALAAAYWIGERSIRRPVASLLAVSGEWARGNFAARAKLRDRGCEISRLGAAFNAMADMLDKRDGDLRAKTAQLDVIMDTVPAAIWLAHDAQASRITGSRYAAQLLRLSPGDNQSKTAPAAERPATFRVLKDGREVPAEELPVQRACRGEMVRLEELELEFSDGSKIHELVNAAPVRDAAGRVVGAVGAAIDVTARKQAEERLKLLAAEVDHRAKNMLAVVQAMVRMTRANDAPSLAKAITGRIGALARAHALLSESRWHGADLRRLVTEELAPYRAGTRIRIDGPLVALGPRAAQSLAMAVHELATNATKYGALSVPEGRVAVEWIRTPGGDLALRWSESGGPPVSPPTHAGLGTSVIQRSIEDQLAGAVRLDWRPEGLVCDVTVPAAALTDAEAATA